MSAQPARKITRDDLEDKLREIRGDIDTTAEAAKPMGLAAAAVGVVVVLAAAYFLGKRRGRKRAAWVEIRRV